MSYFYSKLQIAGLILDLGYNSENLTKKQDQVKKKIHLEMKHFIGLIYKYIFFYNCPYHVKVTSQKKSFGLCTYPL